MVSGGVYRLPRLVVAAPASGHGKTTIATGLMAALRLSGYTVSGHKIGPDYIDPGYHSLATGRPGRNLDPHLVSSQRIAPLLLHGADGADLAIIEGVMGLYDGQIGTDGFSSTAHVAQLTSSPIILVVDISHASRTIAAMVHGMAQYDAGVDIAGVILNKAGSTRHADEVSRALESTGIPVVGVLFRDDGVAAPERHLGLVPAAERQNAARGVEQLAAKVSQAIDLDRLVRIARSAENLSEPRWRPDVALAPFTTMGLEGPERPVIAVAGGRAFTFRYTETTELLAAAGAQIAVFDPLTDETLPPGTRGIYLGGGFPEVHAGELSDNTVLRHSLLTAINAGMPVVAECAGLLYLSNSMDGSPMIGAIDADAQMTSRLTLAYHHLNAPTDSVITAAGQQATGHEFHRTTISPIGKTAWQGQHGATGFATASMHASYVHTHWAGYPEFADRFMKSVRAATPGAAITHAAAADRSVTAGRHTAHVAMRDAPTDRQPVTTAGSLHFHGDAELGEGLLDFAVNINDAGTPDWLTEALDSALSHIDRYPDAVPAQKALANMHDRQAAEVVPTAGAAEAFTLIARSRRWQRPVVVHPQFSEPDAALTACGYTPEHVVLSGSFGLDPDRIPENVDLVFIGNPTNPTGVLHDRAVLAKLIRPGRLVVVDEAFMDAVPGEPESLASPGQSGVAIIRSLTKMWAIPGIRAGYVLTDETTAQSLRGQQRPWSVSTHATAAMIACSGEQARGEARRRATQYAAHRAMLTEGLTELGINFVRDGAAPFVLAQLGQGGHARLRAAGYALRRCDTFPGLNDSWVRIAVRAPHTTAKLLAVLRSEGAPWI